MKFLLLRERVSFASLTDKFANFLDDPLTNQAVSMLLFQDYQTTASPCSVEIVKHCMVFEPLKVGKLLNGPVFSSSKRRSSVRGRCTAEAYKSVFVAHEDDGLVAPSATRVPPHDRYHAHFHHARVEIAELFLSYWIRRSDRTASGFCARPPWNEEESRSGRLAEL